MLYPRAGIEVHEFLDLRFFEAGRGFVDGHFYGRVVGSGHDGGVHGGV